ncbi:hypothetical protein G7046_g6128 [Stylonectria norvegica]|nr:hypothetical protein G7046_g6128 [Stylonectria norvegica]
MGFFQRFQGSKFDAPAPIDTEASDSEPSIIHDGGLAYTRAKGGNDSGPSYQDAGGAPVETSSPLGYNVGWITVIFLNINMMVGTGIFSTPASILNATGSIGLSLIYWFIGFLMAAAGFSIYLELASYFPNRSGGDVVYLEQQYPKPRYFFPIAFAVQDILLSFGSSNAVVLSQYLWSMSDTTPSQWQMRGVAIGAYTLAMICIIVHNKYSLWLSNAIGVVKVLVLVFISISGLVVLGGNVKSIPHPKANFHNAFEGVQPNGNDLASALVSIVFSYAGYYNAFYVVNEIKNPIPTLKRNGAASLLVVAVLYMLCNIAYFAVVPKEEFKGASQIAASMFFDKLFNGSKSASRVLNFLVALSAFGNLLAGTVGQSRMVREIGRQGVLPYTNFWVSTKPFGTPLGPYLVNFVITIIMIVAPPAGDAFTFVVTLQTYPSALFRFAMTVGVYILRRRRSRSGLGRADFKAWHVTVVFFILIQVFMLAMPWWPPKGGAYAGAVSFWYATYCVVGIGILVLCAVYYILWMHLLPKWKGYEIRTEVTEVDGNGANTHRLVKIPKEEILRWDDEHDEGGPKRIRRVLTLRQSQANPSPNRPSVTSAGARWADIAKGRYPDRGRSHGVIHNGRHRFRKPLIFDREVKNTKYTNMSEKPKSAIIVGAGAGGVALAARLAKAGIRVTVVEKNSFTGGRCSLIYHDGHRFDQGPSLFLLPRLFHETFADLDTTLPEAGVDLLRCPTNYNVWFHDGERFQHSSDLAAMRTEIERWEGPEGFERWVSWLQEGHRHYEISVDQVLKKNFTNIWDMARPSFVAKILDMHPFESIWARAGRYFHTERLRRVFTFATMYMGMSPFDAPATYSLLQYTEFAEGIWYPKGGFHTVVDALVRIGEKYGVNYQLSTPVSRVVSSPDGKKATGVLLENGEELKADVVVLNADLVYAYSNLLPRTPTIEKVCKKLQKKDASCSSISFYWSLDRKVPELSTHNIFLAEEYKESFDSIFAKHVLPEEPSFYVNVPSRVDPTAAPPDRDTVIVLVPVGHLARSQGEAMEDGLPVDEQRWEMIVEQARTAVLLTISARIGVSIKEAIVHEIVNTPLTWESKFNLDKGAILGLSHNFFNVLWFRPQTKATEIENTYFVGASTHPGTGVPIVLAGAKITAEQILGDLGMASPWRKQVSKGPRVSEVMDGKRNTWFKFGTEEFSVIMLAILAYVLIGYLLPSVAAVLC